MATISISDFRFTPTGYGRYDVSFTSPKTGKQWSCSVTYMPIIDSTKNCDSPKQSDLNELKRICKRAIQSI